MAKRHFDEAYNIVDGYYFESQSILKQIQDQLKESGAIVNPELQSQLEETIKPLKENLNLYNATKALISKDKKLFDIQFKDIENNYLEAYDDCYNSGVTNPELISKLESVLKSYEYTYFTLRYHKWLLDMPNRESKKIRYIKTNYKKYIKNVIVLSEVIDMNDDVLDELEEYLN